MMFSL